MSSRQSINYIRIASCIASSNFEHFSSSSVHFTKETYEDLGDCKFNAVFLGKADGRDFVLKAKVTVTPYVTEEEGIISCETPENIEESESLEFSLDGLPMTENSEQCMTVVDEIGTRFENVMNSISTEFSGTDSGIAYMEKLSDEQEEAEFRRMHAPGKI